MKNFLVLMFSVFMFALFPATLAAQTDTPLKTDTVLSAVDTVVAATPVVAPATTNPLEGVFLSLAALIAVIPIIVQWLKKLLPNSPPLVTQIISWLTGIILAIIGWYFNLGFLSGVTWQLALLYGVGASLVANGVFDTGIVTWIFNLFSIKKKV